MRKLLTTEEVAEMLNTSPSTMRYWAGRNEGPISFKIGRRRMYAVEDVEAFVTAARATSVDTGAVA